MSPQLLHGISLPLKRKGRIHFEKKHLWMYIQVKFPEAGKHRRASTNAQITLSSECETGSTQLNQDAISNESKEILTKPNQPSVK